MSFATDISAAFDNAALDLEDMIDRITTTTPHLRFVCDPAVFLEDTVNNPDSTAAWYSLCYLVVDDANGGRVVARFSDGCRARQFMRRMQQERRATLDYRSMEIV